MTINETLFFRDGKPFEHLRSIGLPALLAARPPGAPIRVWSAATSTGQEAYSVAMAAAESGPSLEGRVNILGTDLARQPLARAQQGLYSQYEVQRGLSIHRLLRHFTRQPDGWRLRPALLAMCQFQPWNLLDDPAPLGRFDVIFCRNVLMYFDHATRKCVLRRLLRQLAPDGLLYLGLAEVTPDVTDLLERHCGSHAVFQPSQAAIANAA